MIPDSYEAMFDLAPVSLWLEGYSAVKALFEQWRNDGITDVRARLVGHRERIEECSRCIRVLKVNRRTLALYGAADQQQLVDNLGRAFRDDMFERHAEERSRAHAVGSRRADVRRQARVLQQRRQEWAAAGSLTPRTASRRGPAGAASDELLRGGATKSGIFARARGRSPDIARVRPLSRGCARRSTARRCRR